MSRPSNISPGRARLLAIAALVVALGVAVFLASTQLARGSASRAAVVAAAKVHRPTLAAASSAPPIRDALLVGASYTAGLGATPASNGYAYDLGREPGWRTQIDGVSGTGFLNPGPAGHQTFAERILRLPTTPHPDLVVFQGGRNDVNYPMAQLRAEAIATANLTRKRFHGAQVVFLGPIPARVPAPADQLAVASTLRQAAVDCKAVFIDPDRAVMDHPGQRERLRRARPPRIPTTRGTPTSPGDCWPTSISSIPSTVRPSTAARPRTRASAPDSNTANYFPRRGGGVSLPPGDCPATSRSPFVRESALTSRPPFVRDR